MVTHHCSLGTHQAALPCSFTSPRGLGSLPQQEVSTCHLPHFFLFLLFLFSSHPPDRDASRVGRRASTAFSPCLRRLRVAVVGVCSDASILPCSGPGSSLSHPSHTLMGHRRVLTGGEAQLAFTGHQLGVNLLVLAELSGSRASCEVLHLSISSMNSPFPSSKSYWVSARPSCTAQGTADLSFSLCSWYSLLNRCFCR